MTTPIPAASFADPAPAQRLERTATALTAHGFTVETLDDTVAARTRVKDLIPEGASVFTGASETLRLSGIDKDINNSGRYDAIRPAVWPWTAPPKWTRSGGCSPAPTSSWAASTRSPKPAPSWSPRPAEASYPATPVAPPARSGSSGRKVVPDLSTALRRIEDHALPLENDRAHVAYGQPSAINRLLILNAEPHPGRGTVLLLREAIGF